MQSACRTLSLPQNWAESPDLAARRLFRFSPPVRNIRLDDPSVGEYPGEGRASDGRDVVAEILRRTSTCGPSRYEPDPLKALD